MEQPPTEEENHSNGEQSAPPAENPPPIETPVPQISIEQNGDANDKELSPTNHRRGTTIDFHDLSSINTKPEKMYRSQSVAVMRRSLDGLSEEREITQFPNGTDEQPVRLRVRVNGNTVRQITSRGFVETQTRLESVKSVVSKFGGSVDWSLQKINVPQKTQDQQSNVTRMVMAEVSKARREIAQYKMKSETIEVSRAELLKELENTKRHMIRLKSNLDKAEAEEAKVKEELNRAKLYSEIAEIFVQEGGKAEKLNTIKTRKEAAVSELNSVREEIKSLKEECTNLVKERETLVAKAEEAILASKKAEKMVEELNEELDNVRKPLEVATAAKLKAEEGKIAAGLAKDEENLMWEKEMKEAEEELRQLGIQIASAKEVEVKLEAATGLLENLNAELEVYIEKLNRENEGIDSEEAEMKRQELLESTRKELEEVKAQIEKVQGEVNDVQVEISSLKKELEKEKIELSNLQQREKLASVAISSVKTEIEKTKEQIDACIEKEKEAERKIVELPNLIEEATLEAGQSMLVARDAEDELNKVKAEAEPVQISLKTAEMKMNAAMKEIEASKMSENIALAAIKALQESETDNSSEKVIISFDEYFGLSKQGHEADEKAHERVEAASAQMESAKKLATNSLSTLYKVYSELEEKKKVLHEAKQKASRAAQSKMDAEQELKHWRSKNEEQRSSVELDKDEVVEQADEVVKPADEAVKPADEANIEATTTDEVTKPIEAANIEVTTTGVAPNGTIKAEEDKKEEVKIKEAVNGEPNKVLEKSNLEDSFDKSNGCCLSGRSFRSEDGETTGYSSPGSPSVIEGKEKKKKRSFFRKFWSKKKAQSVVT
ncbi:Protein WEAK CHLOROPLAST MOVEMENT UNDER BLUE LIGHT 1 [Rhynchospora pubera]|uniref:Protein WEAK CHLOROPLAST MOVEMENT UNDER BLUE LIGHT 1 n=1 Tax=Rhynchospora pubera TaxID=906938 RepID=A0AAV8C6R3_9POAL|nr:Protein WEAK CHLOROPLAST MOVEMENT UNDER BLUE LIGHT 1 [Rhynchospora pubera]